MFIDWKNCYCWSVNITQSDILIYIPYWMAMVFFTIEKIFNLKSYKNFKTQNTHKKLNNWNNSEILRKKNNVGGITLPRNFSMKSLS